MNEAGEKWGKYQIERLIATGGMAEVFEANLLGPGGFVKRVCLKRVRPELSSNRHFVEMFESEARIAARLDHPNIVSVTDFDRHDGQLFLAMELVDGVDLRQILGLASSLGLRLPPECAVYVLERLLDALDYAHNLHVDGVLQPVIHRDVSPHNILLSADGAVKLTDFGIAKAKGVTNDATAQGTIKGKFAYLSPEQVSGEPLDAGSDLFSAGLVLSEMLTGRRVFRGKENVPILSQVLTFEFEPISGICDPLNDFLSHLLARERAHRFDSARAARSALRNVPVPASEKEETTKLVLATRDALARNGVGPRSLRRTRDFDGAKGPVRSSSNAPVLGDAHGGRGSDDGMAGSGKRGRHPLSGSPVRPATAMFLGLAIAVALIAVAVAVTGVNRGKVAAPVAEPNDGQSLPSQGAEEETPPPVDIAAPPSKEGATQAPIAASEAVRVLRPTAATGGSRAKSTHSSSEVVAADHGSAERAPSEEAQQDQEGRPAANPGDGNSRGHVASAMGFLSVNVRPWAEVRVDGVNRGTTPLKNLRLKAGKHHVVLTNKALGYQESIRTVVKPWEVTTVNRVVKRQE